VIGALLDGLRVVELADEQAEYVGLLLAGLGAEVIKVEPPEGSPTRRIGPFLDDIEGAERSLHFWAYNRGKRSVILDLTDPGGRDNLRGLLASADVFVESTPRGFLDELGLGAGELASAFPALVVARMSPFGDVGPWAGYRGSDLVHLALGGVMANCGYDPRPDGRYDLPRSRPSRGTRTPSRASSSPWAWWPRCCSGGGPDAGSGCPVRSTRPWRRTPSSIS
jgi:crotonobetainyl-CoA:carnitine CoA-transferase CaiB-like acyl-CoA transferase